MNATRRVPLSVILGFLLFLSVSLGMPNGAAAGVGPSPDETRAVAAGTGMNYEEARRAIVITPEVHDLMHFAGAQFPQIFAGLWRTKEDGGRVKVALSERNEAASRALRRHFQFPELIDFVHVRHAMGYLEEIDALIVQEMDDWEAQGIRFTRVGVDVTRNAVLVGYASRSDVVALSDFRDHYGSVAYLVEEEEPTNPEYVGELVADDSAVLLGCTRNDCTAERLRAGLIMSYIKDGSLRSCSMAFTATRSGIEGILSAGHCQKFDNGVLHGNLTLGAVAYHHFADGANTDSE